jgi:hypothetical protein
MDRLNYSSAGAVRQRKGQDGWTDDQCDLILETLAHCRDGLITQSEVTEKLRHLVE